MDARKPCEDVTNDLIRVIETKRNEANGNGKAPKNKLLRRKNNTTRPTKNEAKNKKKERIYAWTVRNTRENFIKK